MDRTKQIEAISGLVWQKHSSTILVYLFGAGDMVRRIRSILLRNFKGDRRIQTTQAFSDTAVDCYDNSDGSATVTPPVPGAILFLAPPQHPLGHADSLNSNRRWCTLDVTMSSDDLSRFIRLELPFRPYAEHSPKRAKTNLENTDPLVFWVIRLDGSTGSLGEVVGVCNSKAKLLHGEMLFANAKGEAKSTVLIRWKWPGYDEPFQKQLRLKSKPGNKADSGTYARLVNSVKTWIRNFISEYADKPSTEQRWAVGPSGITAEDIVLVAIVPMSKGVVMPILKVRDDFEFCDTSVPPRVTDVPGADTPPFDFSASSDIPSAGPSFSQAHSSFGEINAFDFESFNRLDISMSDYSNSPLDARSQGDTSNH
ncbi:hypothetical protein PENSPDRAFT_476815 [Peniophora sp. CONT]|nr:hypothetical protein PENSPDRAFT_476815 [Peniophora sp. CONT]